MGDVRTDCDKTSKSNLCIGHRICIMKEHLIDKECKGGEIQIDVTALNLSTYLCPITVLIKKAKCLMIH